MDSAAIPPPDRGATEATGAPEPEAPEGSKGRLRLALETFFARESRAEAPEGEWRQGLWFPSVTENRPCCDAFTPTPANKQALESHCRSAAHVAALFDIPVLELRRAVRRARQAGEEDPSLPAPPPPARPMTNVERLARISRAARAEAFEAVKVEAREGEAILRALEGLDEDAAADELSALFRRASAFAARLDSHLENAAQMERVLRLSEAAVQKGRSAS